MNRLTVLVALLALLLAACGGDDNEASPTATSGAAPAATATSAPEATPTPLPQPRPAATPEPTATPTPQPGADTAPQGTETGAPALDAIIAAVLARDADALAALFALTEAPCTTAQGLGGPPKCADAPGSPPDGTIVEAFPAASCEGYWAFDIQPLIARLLQPEPELFALIEVEQMPIFPGEEYFPEESHRILFGYGDTSGLSGVVVSVLFGEVVFLSEVCAGPPELALESLGKPYEIILRGPAYQ